MEHLVGIEPAISAWKAEVLPLNYRCNKMKIIGADNENRTRMTTLARWRSTIKLCPHLNFSNYHQFFRIEIFNSEKVLELLPNRFPLTVFRKGYYRKIMIL
jgi:hypothetical protein